MKKSAARTAGTPVIDINTSFGRRVDPDPRFSAEALGAAMDERGVALALTHSMQGVEYYPAGGNDDAVQLAARDGRFIPVCTVNPRAALEWRGEIDRCLDAGARVFRFFPAYQGWMPESRAFRRIAEHLQGRGAVAVMSVSERGGEWQTVRQLAEATADLGLSVILAEPHYSNIPEVLAVMLEHPHLYADTSLLATVGSVELLAREVGARRLLFGSAAPWNPIQKALNEVLEADLTDADKSAILSGNARRLLGISSARLAGRPVLQSLEPFRFDEELVDVHSHLGYWALMTKQEHYDPAAMIGRMKRFGITRSIVSSYESMRYDIAAGNRAVMAAIEGHPELRGYVEVDPHHLELSCAEMDRYYGRPNVVGCEVELTHIPCPTGSEAVRRLMAEVARRGKPILFMPAGGGDAGAERELGRANPGLSIIHAHGFDADWARVVKDTPNIHVEYCLSRATHLHVREGLDILGPERVLFGTDQTLLSVGAAVGLYRDAEMSPAERRLVLGGNARRLFRM